MDQDQSEVSVEDVLTSSASHDCDFLQQGNLVRCEVGGHGFFLPADKMITRDEGGNFKIVDIVLQA